MENADGEARRVLCDVRCFGETLLLYGFSGDKDEDVVTGRTDIFSFFFFFVLAGWWCFLCLVCFGSSMSRKMSMKCKTNL